MYIVALSVESKRSVRLVSASNHLVIKCVDLPHSSQLGCNHFCIESQCQSRRGYSNLEVLLIQCEISYVLKRCPDSV